MSNVTAINPYRRAHLFADCKLQLHGKGPLRRWSPYDLLFWGNSYLSLTIRIPPEEERSASYLSLTIRIPPEEERSAYSADPRKRPRSMHDDFRYRPGLPVCRLCTRRYERGERPVEDGLNG